LTVIVVDCDEIGLSKVRDGDPITAPIGETMGMEVSKTLPAD
jgi:hypothetical protein